MVSGNKFNEGHISESCYGLRVTGCGLNSQLATRNSQLVILLTLFLLTAYSLLPTPYSYSAISYPDQTGQHVSLKLDYYDNPRLSYFDPDTQDLKYAYWDGNQWIKSTVESDGIVGEFSSLALDPADNPRISYYHQTDSANEVVGALKYAYCNGTCAGQSQWTTVTVDQVSGGNVGGYTSLSLDASGRPRIAYYDLGNGYLKFAYCNAGCNNSSNWTKVIVDTTGGRYASLALTPSGEAMISYYSEGLGAVKYAYSTNLSSWTTREIDTQAGCCATSIVADPVTGAPRMTYQINTLISGYNRYYLYYAYCDSNCDTTGQWTKVQIDSNQFAGYYSSIALSPVTSLPRLAFYYWGYYETRWWVPASGIPWGGKLNQGEAWNWGVSQTDVGNLYYISCADVYCTGSSTYSLDTASDTGHFSSLTMDSSDNPVVAYYDFIYNKLKLYSASDFSSGRLPITVDVWASDTSNGGAGVQAGDTIVLGFSGMTNCAVIDNSNIDTVFPLSNGHTWLDGSGNIGSVLWNNSAYTCDTLTITLIDTGGAPTIAAGDTVCVDGAFVKDSDSLGIFDCTDITGSFGSVLADAALYLSLDENGIDTVPGDGYDVYDSSGNKNHARLGGIGEFPETSDPTFTTGISGSALNFDGTDDYVYVADDNSLDITGELTIEAWVYLSAIPATDGWYDIAYKGDSGIANYRFGLVHDNINCDSSGAFLCPGLDFTYAGIWQGSVDWNTKIPAGVWTHLAAVYSDGDDSIRFYRDGIGTRVVNTNSMFANNSGLAIARAGDAGGEYFPGGIDEVVIYNRALSETEVEKRYLVNTAGISSIFATDTACNGVGMQSGDQVVITFNTETNAPSIDTVNATIGGVDIDTVLGLGGNTWKEGNGQIGVASGWSSTIYPNDTLTISLSASITPPTVAVGDTVTLDGATIGTIFNDPIIDSGVIGGSFDNRVTSKMVTQTTDGHFNTGNMNNVVVSGSGVAAGLELFSTLGDGSDGPLLVTSMDAVINSATYLTIDAAPGANILIVNSTAGFREGDEIIVIQMQHSGNAGVYEFVQDITVADANTLVFSQGLTNNYYVNSGSGMVQVVRVPQYTDVTVNPGASITASPWDGYTGGIVVFRATGQVDIQGGIDVGGKGFSGGDRGDATAISGFQGESYPGAGLFHQYANGGGGGGGSGAGSGQAGHGGGGGYGSAGGTGGGVYDGAGGGIYGDNQLTTIYPGSGGGGGGYSYGFNTNGGSGGASGGIVVISGRDITVTGLITANGSDGSPGVSPGGGDGGGGSGGTIYLKADTIDVGVSGTLVTALGGVNGGAGRIKLEYVTNVTGVTDPVAFQIQENLYPPLGIYESNTIDLGAVSTPETISWNPVSQPPNTDIRVQIATNNDNTTWNFAGPDGTGGSYYQTPAGEPVWQGHTGSRYLRYKVYLFSSNLSKTPRLDDITIGYGSANLTFSPDTGYDGIDGIAPDTGVAGITGFTYRIVYTGASLPASVEVNIDGVIYPMVQDTGCGQLSLCDGDPANGEQYIYGPHTFSTTGMHSYYFVTDTNSCIPIGGLSGPVIKTGGTSSGSVTHTTDIDFLNGGVVGLWRLNTVTSGQVSDASGYNNNGTLLDGASLDTLNQKLGAGALSLDGVDDYVMVGDVGSAIKTVEFWINNSNTQDGVLELNTSAYVTISSSSISVNGFTSPVIYVNGSSDSALLNSGWNHVVITTDTGVTGSGVNLGVGHGDYMSGMIDEVVLYSRVITAGEVVGRYNGGAGEEQGITNSILTNTMITGTGVSGSVQLVVFTTGAFTSSPIDMGLSAFFTTLSWNATMPALTNIDIEMRSGDRVTDCTDAAWGGWQMTANITTANPSGSVNIPSILNGRRCVQYQATLNTSDSIATPSLDDITIGTGAVSLSYSPEAGYDGVDGVDPDTGDMSIPFIYKVVYTNLSGQSATSMDVYIDGVAYPMSPDTGCGAPLCDGDYTNGEQYIYTHTFTDLAPHNYYFLADSLVNLPMFGVLNGPQVTGGASQSPVLTYSIETGYNGTDGIDPDTGMTRTTTFTYRVVYTDANNEAPAYIEVYIDGTPYSMTQDTSTTDPVLRDSNYANGEQYIYTMVFSAAGTYTYYFSASDGVLTDSTTPLSGPVVAPDTPQPIVINPIKGQRGDTLSFIIEGYDFDSGTTISFIGPGGITNPGIDVTAPVTVTTVLPPTGYCNDSNCIQRLTTTINISPLITDIYVGRWDVVVTNPDTKQTTMSRAFQVEMSMPAPSQVTDLVEVSRDCSAGVTCDVTLTWTPPVTASGYDVRYSLSLIDDTNWTSATQVPGSPLSGLTVPPVVVTLTNNNRWYVGLKAYNQVYDSSPLSNIVQVDIGDVTPPNPITDLTGAPKAGTLGETTITLNWTAPSDDVLVSQYDIRYSTTPILNDTDFASAVQVTGEPAPQAPGSSEQMDIGGLMANTTYYFAIKGIDKQLT